MKTNEINVRIAEEKDIEQFLDLIMRMKRLNGEFDSMFTANEGNREAIKSYYSHCISDKKNFITLVAESNHKIYGLIKAEIRERISYLPSQEARIIDLYIMPEIRRKKVGNLLLEKLYSEMEKRNVSVVTAEFPAKNLIALNFYDKIGYREIGKVFGKSIVEEPGDERD
ncbi:MAG: GNAT family N-acetyltransferase [Cuniculiplasma sp.]|jgi:ribosomal protein S18 acetylase RimI-like enzyme